jgi:hypothetical protein
MIEFGLTVEEALDEVMAQDLILGDEDISRQDPAGNGLISRVSCHFSFCKDIDT